ncbi:hypothetical protein [Erwinia sp. HR93]|uniref:hypothetical protein n=1 Tax=Erwinia sp. HR93 TaxID=3094840 RepID=UPI002ADED2DB|nr:hypothetical protein [Erwinia sp. HR93]MEA1065031.1 hypothetical protein [Erwinia sp. HR93]
MKDYFIIAMLTLATGWRWSLPICGLLCVWCIRRRKIIASCMSTVLFVWTAIVAWEVEKYL